MQELSIGFKLFYFFTQLAILIWYCCIIRKLNSDDKKFDLGFGITLVTMLFLSPLGWLYYYPLLFLPGLALLRNYQQESYTSWELSGLATCLLVTSLPYNLSLEINPGIHNFFSMATLPTCGLFILFILLQYAIQRPHSLIRNTNKSSFNLAELMGILPFIYLPSFLGIIMVIPKAL